MVWQNIPLADVSVDADRWRRLNNYLRENIDELMNNLRIHEAGEWSRDNGPPVVTMYDVDVDITPAGGGGNQQVYECRCVWVPDGVATVDVTIYCGVALSAPTVYFACALTNFTTGVVNSVNIGTLPSPGPGYVTGQITNLVGNDLHHFTVTAWNNDAAPRRMQFREIYIVPVV